MVQWDFVLPQIPVYPSLTSLLEHFLWRTIPPCFLKPSSRFFLNPPLRGSPQNPAVCSPLLLVQRILCFPLKTEFHQSPPSFTCLLHLPRFLVILNWLTLFLPPRHIACSMVESFGVPYLISYYFFTLNPSPCLSNFGWPTVSSLSRSNQSVSFFNFLPIDFLPQGNKIPL